MSDREIENLMISIHAPREGSDVLAYYGSSDFDISIHAPREGSDVYHAPVSQLIRHFYPRSP